LFRDSEPVRSADDLAREAVFDEGEVEEFLADLYAMRRADLASSCGASSWIPMLPRSASNGSFRPTLLRELMGAHVGITFVTLGELTRWSTFRQWEPASARS